MLSFFTFAPTNVNYTMKTKAKIIITAIATVMFAALPLLTSCDKDDGKDENPLIVGNSPERSESMPSLILGYYECLGLNSLNPQCVWDYRMIPLRAETGYFPSRVNRESYKDFKNLDQHLDRINNDNSFFLKKESIPDYDTICNNSNFIMALFEDFTDAKVEALTDFDAEHPAGSNLTEMAYLSYMSVYPFIQEGYRLNENSKGNGPYEGIAEYEAENRQHPENSEAIESALATYRLNFMPGQRYGVKNVFFHKKLSDIAKDNLRMLHPVGLMYLSFAKKPAKPCRIRMSVDLHLRESSYPTRTVSIELLIK